MLQQGQPPSPSTASSHAPSGLKQLHAGAARQAALSGCASSRRSSTCSLCTCTRRGCPCGMRPEESGREFGHRPHPAAPRGHSSRCGEALAWRRKQGGPSLPSVTAAKPGNRPRGETHREVPFRLMYSTGQPSAGSSPGTACAACKGQGVASPSSGGSSNIPSVSTQAPNCTSGWQQEQQRRQQPPTSAPALAPRAALRCAHFHRRPPPRRGP